MGAESVPVRSIGDADSCFSQSGSTAGNWSRAAWRSMIPRCVYRSNVSEIFDFLHDNKIEGVFVLTADVIAAMRE